MHRSDLRRSCEICRRAGGELGVEFDHRHRPCGADQLRENWRVVPDVGTDMHDVLLDCIGSTERHREALLPLGLPVILLNAVVVKALSELLGG